MATLEDMVTDWELDEIIEQLLSGYAPDVLAFSYDVDPDLMREYARRTQHLCEQRTEHDGKPGLLERAKAAIATAKRKVREAMAEMSI